MRLVLLLVLVLASACSTSHEKGEGEACELTSECAAPLICRELACSVQCHESRDCAAGLRCVVDSAGVGECMLPPVETCVLSSDCPAPLVCASGACTAVCDSDRDCPFSDRCVDNACVPAP